MSQPLLFQPRFRSRSEISAFTLTELLLAATITGSAIMLGGMGLSAMISSSTAVNGRTERQDELNRAMDFIAAEIREAKTVNSDKESHASVKADLKSKIDVTKIQQDSVEPILWLDDDDDGNYDSAYYLARPVGSDGLWRGDKVVYRWGTPFDDDGGKSSASKTSHMLIDSMSRSLDSTIIPDCPGSDWKREPDPHTARDLGFYACIDKTGRAARLFQVGEVQKVLEEVELVPNERQVYSRSMETQPFGTGGGGGGGGGTCISPPCDDEDSMKQTPGGFEILEDLEQVVLRHKGGAISCNKGGSTIKTTTTIILWEGGKDQTAGTKLLTFDMSSGEERIIADIPSGTKVQVKAKADATSTCSSMKIDSKTDGGRQIIVLGNGDPIPYYKPYDNQADIDSFLAGMLGGDNRLALEANRMIFLMELGEIYSDNPGEAFDFQDVIVDINMTPRTISGRFFTPRIVK